jgi:hypothetical protein
VTTSHKDALFSCREHFGFCIAIRTPIAIRFYWAQIEALDEFIPTEEARERALFAPDDARELPFVRTLRELYLVALQAAMS